MSVIARLRSTFFSLGWHNGSWYLLGQALHRMNPRWNIYKYDLVAQPVAAHARLTGRQGASIEIRPILEHDPAIAAMGRPDTVIKQRFKQGCICLGAFKADELVGYVWLQLGAYLEDEVRCCFIPQPAQQAAWDFDIFVHPKQRIGFAFAKLWDAADAFMRARGIHWSMSRISAFNIASLAAHKKLGLKSIGATVYVVLGNTQITMSNLFPFVHVSLSPAQLPCFRINAPRGL